ESPAERGGRRRPARAHRRADRRGDRAPLERARAGGTRLMSGGGLDELTTAQKRALLAEHLRKRSRLAPSPAAIADDTAPAPADDGAAPRAPSAGRRSFLDDEVIELASLRDWSAQEQHPYIRYVAPYKGFLYQRLGLDKTFVRGEGCHLIDADGTRYADFIAQFGA